MRRSHLPWSADATGCADIMSGPSLKSCACEALASARGFLASSGATSDARFQEHHCLRRQP